MCGISGFFNPNALTISETQLDQLAQPQVHRGPDYLGKYYNQYVGFAHNRLSLLDLSANGNQPFEDENFVLVFNGEIYNYLQIKAELPPKAYTSTSDTAVLFHALATWGIDKTVKKIKGMFAFSWFNKNTQELYLVRDRLGIKPLFYTIDSQQTLWFASEVKAILQTVSVEANPFKVLFSSLGNLERSRYATAWDAINQVEPGTYIRYSNGKLDISAYYSILETVDQTTYSRLTKSSLNDVLHEFEHLIDYSVKSMSVSDAAMGSFVSGGIDSSLISHYAVQHNADLKLFTANVLGKHSEFEDAQLLAKTLNKNLYDYKFEKEMALRDWVKVTWHYESPIVVHFNAIPFSNVAQLTREHQVKAVLTGEGSDELFLGYPKLLTKRYERFIKLPYSILDFFYSKVPKLNQYITNTGGSQDLMGVFQKGAQNFSNQLFLDEVKKTYDFVPLKKRGEHLETAKMLHEHLVSLLWRNDRMGMMYSVESRFPFLDEDVIAFGMNLPTQFKIGRTAKLHNIKHPFLVDKFIVRKLAEKNLPNALVYKQKNGFPLHGLRDMIVQPEFFDQSTIAEVMQLTQAQIRYMCTHEWNYLTSILAAVEIWCKLFVERKSIEAVEALVLKHIQFQSK